MFNVFLLCRYYLPLVKDVPFHLKKPEFPSLRDDLCQVCMVKIGPVVLEKSKINVLKSL
jgi:hypothetical protein